MSGNCDSFKAENVIRNPSSFFYNVSHVIMFCVDLIRTMKLNESISRNGGKVPDCLINCGKEGIRLNSNLSEKLY